MRNGGKKKNKGTKNEGFFQPGVYRFCAPIANKARALRPFSPSYIRGLFLVGCSSFRPRSTRQPSSPTDEGELGPALRPLANGRMGMIGEVELDGGEAAIGG